MGEIWASKGIAATGVAAPMKNAALSVG